MSPKIVPVDPGEFDEQLIKIRRLVEVQCEPSKNNEALILTLKCRGIHERAGQEKVSDFALPPRGAEQLVDTLNRALNEHLEIEPTAEQKILDTLKRIEVHLLGTE